MSTRDEYIKKMQTKLEEWFAEIDILTAKAGEVSAGARAEYDEQVESLKVKLAAARQKIEGFQLAGEIAWEDMTSGIDFAWKSIEKSINLARSRFK